MRLKEAKIIFLIVISLGILLASSFAVSALFGLNIGGSNTNSRCYPQSCVEMKKECGTWDAGCSTRYWPSFSDEDSPNSIFRRGFNNANPQNPFKVNCGTCSTKEECKEGKCVCVPSCRCAKKTCLGKTCSDGCGGKCKGIKDCNRLAKEGEIDCDEDDNSCYVTCLSGLGLKDWTCKSELCQIVPDPKNDGNVKGIAYSESRGRKGKLLTSEGAGKCTDDDEFAVSCRNHDFSASCTVTCPKGYGLSDWVCSEAAKCEYRLSQKYTGLTQGIAVSTKPGNSQGVSASGKCSKKDSFSVRCAVNDDTGSCSVYCPAGYSLTDWKCDGDYALCSVGASLGGLAGTMNFMPSNPNPKGTASGVCSKPQESYPASCSGKTTCDFSCAKGYEMKDWVCENSDKCQIQVDPQGYSLGFAVGPGPASVKATGTCAKSASAAVNSTE